MKASWIRVEGRVLDVFGNPVPGVPVGWRGSETVAAPSDVDGGFSFEAPQGSVIVPVGSRYVALGGGVAATRAVRETVLEVCPAVAVSGRVTDSSGLPLPDARVELRVDGAAFSNPEFLARWRQGGGSVAAKLQVDGRYFLERVPAGIDGIVLAVRLDGTENTGLSLELDPDVAHHEVDIAVPDRSRVPDAVCGTVLHHDGRPAPGAAVYLGGLVSARADDRGRFSLAPIGVPDAAPLVAVKAGLQPAVVERFGLLLRTGMTTGRDLRLRLGGPALELAGVLRDAEGAPLSGVSMRIEGGLRLAVDGRMPPLLVEALTAGATVETQTDPQGRFRFRGLMNRPYAIRAWRGSPLLSLRFGPFPAGRNDLDLAVPPDAIRESLRGRVVGDDLAPLAGVEVTPAVPVYDEAGGYGFVPGETVVTAVDGTFLIAHIPRENVYLRLEGRKIVPRTHALRGDEAGPLVIRVERLAGLVFEDRRGALGVDEIEVRDDRGEALPLYSFRDGQRWVHSRGRLVDGRSGVLFASVRASRLVSFRLGREVAEFPLRLEPGRAVLVGP